MSRLTPPTTAQITRNALSGGGRFAVAAALALIVTPFALGVLGDVRFGVWALAGAMVTTLRLLDLGLNRALVRAVAESRGCPGRGDARSYLSAGRGVAMLLGLSMAVVGWAVHGLLIGPVLHLPRGLWPEAAYVLVGSAVVAGVETTFAPFQAALDGDGRMDLSNAVDTGQRIMSALGVVLVLSLGWGLRGLVWKNLATAVMAGLAYWWLLRQRSPHLSSARPSLAVQEVRSLLRFGRHVQTVNLGAMLIDPVSKALLSRHVGLDAVALYELASRIVGQLAGAFLALATALFPAAAEIRSTARAEGDKSVARLCQVATRYLAWMALPTYGLVAVVAPAFVMAWVGTGYERVAWAVVVLAAGWLVAVVSTPAFVIAQAAGREALSTRASLVTVGMALASAAVLVEPAGLEGVVSGVAAGLALGGAAMLALFGRGFKMEEAGLLQIGWRAVVAAATAMATARLLIGIAPPTLAAVFVVAALGMAVYVALMLLGGELSMRELSQLRRAVRGWRSVGDEEDA